jgi:hypothetical protein
VTVIAEMKVIEKIHKANSAAIQGDWSANLAMVEVKERQTEAFR